MLWEGLEPQVTLGGEIPVRNGRMPNLLASTQLGNNLQREEQESSEPAAERGRARRAE